VAALLAVTTEPLVQELLQGDEDVDLSSRVLRVEERQDLRVLVP
jgi:hypothetical protein